MLSELLNHDYGLKNAALTPMAKGAVNRNYRVEAPGGAYVLKQFARVYRREDALRSCLVQGRLREAGLPVPLIRPNRRGDLLTETPDGIFMVSEFVPGRQYERAQLPPAAARAMGQTLGRLHQVLAQGEEHRYIFPRRETVVARLRVLLGHAEARRSESPVDEAACRILQEKLEALAAWGETPGDTPAQWVHGDYQETNVIFAPDDTVAAVIDFDNVRVRPRGYEVMRAFAYSFATELGPAEAAYDFYAGYLASTDANATEIARWSSEWTYLNLVSDWPIGSRYLEPETYDPRWDRFMVHRPNWWLRHHQEVTERFLRMCKG